MTHTTEEDISKKVDEIYTLLVGVGDQPETGFIGRTNNRLTSQGKRLDSLEKWRWLIVGGSIVIGALIGMIGRVAK
jgi:hypothetical protein